MKSSFYDIEAHGLAWVTNGKTWYSILDCERIPESIEAADHGDEMWFSDAVIEINKVGTYDLIVGTQDDLSVFVEVSRIATLRQAMAFAAMLVDAVDSVRVMKARHGWDEYKAPCDPGWVAEYGPTAVMLARRCFERLVEDEGEICAAQARVRERRLDAKFHERCAKYPPDVTTGAVRVLDILAKLRPF